MGSPEGGTGAGLRGSCTPEEHHRYTRQREAAGRYTLGTLEGGRRQAPQEEHHRYTRERREGAGRHNTGTPERGVGGYTRVGDGWVHHDHGAPASSRNRRRRRTVLLQ